MLIINVDTEQCRECGFEEGADQVEKQSMEWQQRVSRWLDELSRLAGKDLVHRRTRLAQAKPQVAKLELA